MISYDEQSCPALEFNSGVILMRFFCAHATLALTFTDTANLQWNKKMKCVDCLFESVKS